MRVDKLIVKSHSPQRRLVIAAGIIVSVLASGWGLYEYGRYQAGFDKISFSKKQADLQDLVAQIEANNSTLREEIAVAKRSTQVDGKAYGDVKESLKTLQEEVLELREEVTFYRGIVSPAESNAGVHVERFELVESGDDFFHYKLVLTQVLKNNRNISGSVAMTIDGVLDGRPHSLSLKNVLNSRQNKIKFRFRYFQKLEDDLKLPAGFIPRSVLIEVKPKGRQTVKRSFDWVAINE